MVVTEIYSWGVQGYITPLCSEQEPKGLAYYRCPNEKTVLIGSCAWMVKNDEEPENVICEE